MSTTTNDRPEDLTYGIPVDLLKAAYAGNTTSMHMIVDFLLERGHSGDTKLASGFFRLAQIVREHELEVFAIQEMLTLREQPASDEIENRQRWPRSNAPEREIACRLSFCDFNLRIIEGDEDSDLPPHCRIPGVYTILLPWTGQDYPDLARRLLSYVRAMFPRLRFACATETLLDFLSRRAQSANVTQAGDCILVGAGAQMPGKELSWKDVVVHWRTFSGNQ